MLSNIQSNNWLFRPIVIDGSNVGRSASHQQSPDSKRPKFNNETIVIVIIRLLKCCLHLCLECETFKRLPLLTQIDLFERLICKDSSNSVIKCAKDPVVFDNVCQSMASIKGDIQKVESVRKHIIKILSEPGSSIGNFNCCSEFWAAYRLPPIYIFWEEVETKDSLLNEFRQYAFVSFLILPISDGKRFEIPEQEQPNNRIRIYGDRLLLDFAATVNAVIISNDEFKDLKRDALLSDIEKQVIEDDVVHFVTVSDGDYAYMDPEYLLSRVNMRPDSSSAQLFGDIPEHFDPISKYQQKQASQHTMDVDTSDDTRFGTPATSEMELHTIQHTTHELASKQTLQFNNWPLRPIVISGGSDFNKQSSGSKGQKVNQDHVNPAIAKLLKFYLSRFVKCGAFENLSISAEEQLLKELISHDSPDRVIRIEIKDLITLCESDDEIDVESSRQKITAMRQKLIDKIGKPNSSFDFNRCSRLWAAYGLPPIYIFLEPEERNLNENSVISKFRQYAFISFLIIANSLSTKEIGKIHGNRLLLDFAATMDAVIISNDWSKNPQYSTGLSESEERVIKCDVITYQTSGLDYVFLSNEEWSMKVNRTSIRSHTMFNRDIIKEHSIILGYSRKQTLQHTTSADSSNDTIDGNQKQDTSAGAPSQQKKKHQSGFISPEMDNKEQQTVSPEMDDKEQQTVSPEMDNKEQQTVSPEMDDKEQQTVSPEMDDKEQQTILSEMEDKEQQTT